MKNRKHSRDRTGTSIEVFQPKPNVLYNLDAAAHLAGVTRRSLLVYCRAGLIRPIFQPPYGMMVFSEETIHTVRRIEHMRTTHALSLAMLKTLFDLFEEVDRLRSELRFLRNT